MKNDFENRGDITAIFMKPKNGDIIETIIDTIMLPVAKQIPFNWFVVGSRVKTPDYLYAGAYLKGKLILLHRALTSAPPSMVVDHINHSTIDNRLCNLRVISSKENHQNRKPNKDNKSGIPGVWWDKRKGKWCASIKKDGKTIHLGTFADIDIAGAIVAEARKLYLPYSAAN